MRPLAPILGEAGLTIPLNYILTGIVAASNDGTRVLGTAMDGQGLTVTFVLTLPLSAYGL
jgi:hypothetical protein